MTFKSNVVNSGLRLLNGLTVNISFFLLACGAQKNTGLRPSWDMFWEIDSDGQVGKSDSDRTTTNDTTKSSGIKVVKFVTGSEWIGEWDKLGMCGMGMYKMPHGVIYEGAMNAGVFEGIGVLRYPNGGFLEGFWHGGKLKYCQYDYADGLKRDSTLAWPYCQIPDRRFYSELLLGLKPAETEHVTNEDPPREIPPGQYDVGDGFYNPRTKCVTDPVTGDVLRIPTAADEMLIIEYCRTADIGTVGNRPDLYENWFTEDVEYERQYSVPDKEMISLILQEGYDLDSAASSTRTSHARSSSLPSKVDNLDSIRDLRSASSMWSRSTGDLEVFLKKILREMEESKIKSHIKIDLESQNGTDEDEEDDDDSNDESILRMIHRMALSYSGKIDRLMAESDHFGSEVSKRRTTSPETSLPKVKEHRCSIATPSSSTTPHPLAHSDLSSFSCRIRPVIVNSSEHLNPASSFPSAVTGSEFLGSKVHYKIDYSKYEGSDNNLSIGHF